MHHRICLSTFLIALAAVPGLVSARGAEQPNVLLIVSDDQGYGDIGVHRHPPEVKTPNLDRIARAGVRFTNGYASGYVCAPTRAGLLTGRYQQRFGFYTAADSRIGLPTSEITIADVLKKAGYRTGVFGKWHVGLEYPYQPNQRGFDQFYGFLGHGAHDYFKLKRSRPFNSIRRNNKIIDDRGYLTDNLARETTAFIERNREHPFFAYLAFNAVHWPLQAPAEDIKRHHTGSENRDVYLAMLDRMDIAVGRVLDTLARHGLTKKTLIIFFSDNGGAKKNYADNRPLRDYKQSVYEGGIRVPFLVSWPGVLPDGQSIDTPVISLDVFPTICAAAGVSLPEDRVYDGKNFLPAARGEQRGPLHRALYWDGDQQRTAVRAGQWKLVNNRGKVELFNLENDVAETTDLAAEHPQTVARLERMFQKWRSQMGTRLKK